jgi:hypothetical protein
MPLTRYYGIVLLADIGAARPHRAALVSLGKSVRVQSVKFPLHIQKLGGLRSRRKGARHFARWRGAGASAGETAAVSLLDLTGRFYFGGAFVLGVLYLAACFAFAKRRDAVGARRLMFTSLLYLPATLAVMLVDRLVF